MQLYRKTNLSIKAWAEEDRPREKLLLKGHRNLSNAELLAIVIGSGSRNESAVELAKRILAEMNNDLNKLGKQTIEDLMLFKGIGEAKAVSIIAGLEIGRRRQTVDVGERKMMKGSQDIFEVFHAQLRDLPHEEFWILCLNRSNKIIRKERISSGGVSHTIVDTKIIFKKALAYLSSSIILCHNHPSGRSKPSQADIKLTKRVVAGGKLLDVTVLDHLIIGENEYYSFADSGMIE